MKINKVVYLASIIFIAFSFTPTLAQKPDSSVWNALLQENVSEEGMVSYKSFNSEELDLYLKELKKYPPKDSWSKKEKLSYWINAYNAFTIKLILDNYPLKSIKDIKDPWDKQFIEIDRERFSLNHIEHEILRKMDEPRIHFAINCASISCPKLLNQAFIPSKLDEQLETVTREFINDTAKNELSHEKIEISALFKWFREDFEKKQTLIGFLNKYSKVTIDKNAEITYKPYNWNLNGK
ncbi:DUF547 domain-containing protein [Galbibacter sp. BG1]|uniref:DUF547 domain-containing protein n=1 Tax=Galbibacter sp. BG1 TaxID=1170699 RepID=UPI0015BAD573|nr:DUF547 domain-containing protein [Galbibacter sp. BG1]QLE00864.1 DUF547 domain-containing protein [Galbibacter sp. BG1]